MHEGSRKAVVAAFMANLGIALAKFIGFAFTGSAGMLAEAVHSVADTGNQGLLFLGGSRAKKQADDAHPFGYARERYFWAFIVAVMLFTLGAAFALYEGIQKVIHPRELESFEWAVIILGLSFGLESLSLRTGVRETNRVRGNARWRDFVRDAKIPELPVVLLEDIGALVGLGFALAGVILAEVTGNPRFDAVGSIAIGLLLAMIAAFLATEMKSLLIGEAADPAQQQTISNAILSAPRVQRIIHQRTEHLGPEELLVGVKIEFDHSMRVEELSAAIDEVEVRIRTVVPEARWLYIEPDVLHTESEPLS